jgi:hypothetical protein
VLSAAADYRPNNFDRLVVVVERTIGGKTRRYLEYQEADPEIPDVSSVYTGVNNEAADLARYRNLVFEQQKKFNRLDSSLILDTTQTGTLTLSALTGNSVTATANIDSFVAGDVGKYIFIKYITGDEAGVAKIIGFTSTKIVTVQILQDFLSLAIPTLGWYLLTSEVNGLGHLEGATVGVVTDGGIHADKVVTNGKITLDYPARYVIVGYKYLGFGRSMDLEFGAQIGVAAGRPKNILKLIFKFLNTMGGKFGTTSRKLYKVSSIAHRKSSSDYTDRPPLLFSGVKELANFDDWGVDKHFFFLQDEPQPMTVLAVVPLMDVTTE